MPVVVHHLENSRSTRVLFLLEELGVDYKIKTYERDPKTRLAPASLREVHPLGKAPVVQLDDGTVIAESGAIIEHFVKGSKLAPNAKDEALHSSLLHFAEGTLMVHMMARLYLTRVLPKDDPKTKPTLQAMVGNNIDRELQYLEDILGDRDFFVGDHLTGADVILAYSIDGAVSAQPGKWAKLESWRERIQSRPAWKRAVEKGGPIDFGMFQPKL